MNSENSRRTPEQEAPKDLGRIVDTISMDAFLSEDDGDSSMDQMNRRYGVGNWSVSVANTPEGKSADQDYINLHVSEDGDRYAEENNTK